MKSIKNRILSSMALLILTSINAYGMNNGFDLDTYGMNGGDQFEAFMPSLEERGEEQFNNLVRASHQAQRFQDPAQEDQNQQYEQQFVLQLAPPAQLQELAQNGQGVAGVGFIKNIKRNQCPDCGKMFRVPSLFNRHMRIHTGERPFACKICGRGFSEKSNLTKHMRTHTGERSHECSWEGCGKRFSQKPNLTAHMRTHTKEKPYKCPDCDMRFAQQGSCNRHRKTHRNSVLTHEEEQKSGYEEGRL